MSDAVSLERRRPEPPEIDAAIVPTQYRLDRLVIYGEDKSTLWGLFGVFALFSQIGELRLGRLYTLADMGFIDSSEEDNVIETIRFPPHTEIHSLTLRSPASTFMTSLFRRWPTIRSLRAVSSEGLELRDFLCLGKILKAAGPAITRFDFNAEKALMNIRATNFLYAESINGWQWSQLNLASCTFLASISFTVFFMTTVGFLWLAYIDILATVSAKSLREITFTICFPRDVYHQLAEDRIFHWAAMERALSRFERLQTVRFNFQLNVNIKDVGLEVYHAKLAEAGRVVDTKLPALRARGLLSFGEAHHVYDR
ncbi:hypothetical protein BKA93DRAFT_747402 [Sparassis latifolia]